jgi:putative tryptophan/tyrosine transport system substrate-binding protein
MRRRSFVRVAALACAAPAPVFAQTVRRRRRIALLQLDGARMEPLRRGLRDLGWIDGDNLSIEMRHADNQPDRLPALAAELVDLDVEIIVTQTTAAAQAAKRATSTIPIVMAGTADPVGDGLVRSLQRPGGNVTGMTNNPGPGFATKMVELLKEAAPNVARLAVLERGVDHHRSDLARAVSQLNVTLLDARVATPDDVPGALAAALRGRADGLFVGPIPANDAQRSLIVKWTLDHRIPAIGGDALFTEAGGLMSYWTDWAELRHRTAAYVDKILKGMHPSMLPVEQPSKFELVINGKTARHLGLTLSESLRVRADRLV